MTFLAASFNDVTGTRQLRLKITSVHLSLGLELEMCELVSNWKCCFQNATMFISPPRTLSLNPPTHTHSLFQVWCYVWQRHASAVALCSPHRQFLWARDGSCLVPPATFVARLKRKGVNLGEIGPGKGLLHVPSIGKTCHKERKRC